MYLARHDYNKPHRCPGWSGSGWNSPKRDRCDGGFINIDYESRWRWFRSYRCSVCDVRTIPEVTRWLDYTWWSWRIQRRWRDWRDNRAWRRSG